MLNRNGLIHGFAAASLVLMVQAGVAQEKKDLKIHKQVGSSTGGNIGPLSPYSSMVIRSAGQLAAHCDSSRAKDPAFQREIETMLVDRLKVKSIDWKKQMVVAHAAEVEPSRLPLPPVEFTSLHVEKGVLVIRWTLNGPEGGGGGGGASPAGVALIDRYDGPVVFKSTASLPVPR